MRNTRQEVLLIGKTITGTLQGNIRPPLDVPKYVDLLMAGKLPIDKLITRNYTAWTISMRPFRLLEKRGNTQRNSILALAFPRLAIA